MNILSIMRAAALGNIQRLRPMILWTIFEYLLRGAPYGILLGVVWELFKPLQHPGAPLNVRALLGLSAAMAISLALLFLVSKKAYLKMYYETYDLCADGRLEIGDHLRQLSMGFFDARDPGMIGSYLIDDYANVEFMLSHLVPQIAGAAAMPVLLLIFLAFQNWRLALVSALVIPAAIPFSFLTRAFINHFGKKHQKARIDASSRMLEYVQGMRLIKAFNLTGAKFERLEKTFRTFKSLSIKLEAGGGPTILLSGFVLHAGLALIILFGLTFLFAGTISLPVYIMFLILGTRVYEPLMQALDVSRRI
jgi:ATP-binding cassette subfamily B protein